MLTSGRQTRDLQTGTAQILGHLCTDFFVFIGCTILAFMASWQLTLALIASVPITFPVLALLGRSLEPATEAQRQELSEAATYATASLAAIDVVKVYNAYDDELWQYLQRIRRAMGHYLVQAQCASSQMGFIKLWMSALFVTGFWLGVYLVDAGKATPGNVLTAFYAVMTSFQSVEALGTQWLVVVKGMVAGAALEKLATSSTETSETLAANDSVPAVPAWTPTEIELRNVDAPRPLEDCSGLTGAYRSASPTPVIRARRFCRAASTFQRAS